MLPTLFYPAVNRRYRLKVCRCTSIAKDYNVLVSAKPCRCAERHLRLHDLARRAARTPAVLKQPRYKRRNRPFRG